MTPRNPHHERRWLIFAVVGIAQLVVVLDATIVNVASVGPARTNARIPDRASPE